MPHPDDEFLSALLDGEAPSGDTAHVDGCAECQERVETLRHATTIVAAAVALPPAHVREASLAIAVDSASTKPSARSYARRWNGLSAAAALVVALAVGGLLISQVGRTGNDDTTANAERDTSAAASAAGGFAEDSTFSATGDGASGVYQAGDLGTIDDIALVFQRSSADLDASGRAQAEMLAADAAACPVEIAGQTLWQASLTFRGEAALAYLVETETGSVMQILRRADCSVLASQGF
ncbi:MAG: hypothetical protein Q8K63_15370 [Acidimicrobiales bacterium]|nr:hypothetical protein [Acidimicrobiales bacterium]